MHGHGYMRKQNSSQRVECFVRLSKSTPKISDKRINLRLENSHVEDKHSDILLAKRVACSILLQEHDCNFLDGLISPGILWQYLFVVVNLRELDIGRSLYLQEK